MRFIAVWYNSELSIYAFIYNPERYLGVYIFIYISPYAVLRISRAQGSRAEGREFESQLCQTSDLYN